ncbi:hypothetical protein F444_07652 [Phytophthora nicotianae P1976]|uniref:Uncharacterized protein n=1 Tax=Phytophthora nicotianae P1976 TaxID=1317066 RepID=A0A081ADZ3_PHYNI|nr:hypothetical protein F444_07652 [Phytophthora nicotianae P1976]
MRMTMSAKAHSADFRRPHFTNPKATGSVGALLMRIE